MNKNINQVLKKTIFILEILFFIFFISCNISKRFGDFKWAYDEYENIRITGYTGSGGLVTVPAMINNKPITSIGNKAFFKKNITNIILPDSITLIGKQSFSSNRLINVNIGNNVKSISNLAFSNNELSFINIPNNVIFIGEEAFKDNPLIRVKIGANVNIENNAIGNGFENIYISNARVADTLLRTDTYNSNWSSAWSHYKRGEDLRNEGNFTDAVKEYTSAIQIDPDFIDAYLYRGISYKYTVGWSHSIPDFNHVIQIDSKNINAFLERGKATNNISDFNHVLSLDPNNAEAYIERAKCYGLAGDSSRQLADANKAIQIDPTNIWGYHIRGHYYQFRAKNYSKAIDDYSMMTLIAPDKYYGYDSLAGIYFDQKNYTKAIENWEKALKFVPENWGGGFKDNISYAKKLRGW